MQPRPADDILELTILMPCLNEAQTLEQCIVKAREFLDRSGVAGEVLIADNGSTDGSREIALRCGARVVEVPRRGYGAALAGGSIAARGRYIIMGDADGSYDFLSLMPFLAALRQGADLVMGNRFLGGIRPGAMPWKNRWIGNPALSTIGRLFFRTAIGDFHCGLRGCSAEAFRSMDLRTTGMEFASEMVIKATLFKMKVAEVPTSLSPDGRNRPPHLRPWRDGWRHLRYMLLYSPRWHFLYPGAALLLAGGALMVALLFGRLRIGRISLDVDTLLYASAMIMIGFQSVIFAIYSKIFGITAGFLPKDSRLALLRRTFTLEAGIATGCVLIVAGLSGTFWGMAYWGGHSFGEVNPDHLLRIVAPSVLLMTLGIQTVLSSFFLSLLLMTDRADARSHGE